MAVLEKEDVSYKITDGKRDNWKERKREREKERKGGDLLREPIMDQADSDSAIHRRIRSLVFVAAISLECV